MSAPLPRHLDAALGGDGEAGDDEHHGNQPQTDDERSHALPLPLHSTRTDKEPESP
eukprot:CAMPEP_0169473086 /NCGR_PEP_ID=MMETSP1042-20121227/25521_1 /TAXON_ID=464988 /ORGANISM="Hemiselmis andersenii, Strain CCMP1180" /LENGTH=55 /DNA_ID=CAMNT_0009586997 /DNA_START=94 /DNA_END=257 /DNA_ORIENTATION=+